jgi:beta-hydroxylase
MFHDPGPFAFVGVLEQNWRTILAEFHAIRGDLIDWHEKDLYGEGWKVFGLYDFPHGSPIGPNISRCPHTAALVRDHVPRHGAAGFSVLAPGVHVRPHQGYPGEFLRCHLGLQVPAGDCALCVGGEVRRWEAGKALVFDDRVTHEAWNLTDRQRVVLLVDFVPGR